MLSDKKKKKKKKTSVTRLSREICFAPGNSIILLKYGRRIGKKGLLSPVDFPKNSREILKDFFRNAEINLRLRRIGVTDK